MRATAAEYHLGQFDLDNPSVPFARMAPPVSPSDSGEHAGLRAYDRRADPDQVPKWLKQAIVVYLIGSFGALLTGVVIGARWSARMEEKMNSLSSSVAVGFNSVAKDVESARIEVRQLGEKVEVLDLKVQNLNTEYKILKDRFDREGGTP